MGIYGNDLIGDLFDDDKEQEIEILVVNRERIVLENSVEDELNNNSKNDDEDDEFDDDEDELDDLNEDEDDDGE